ncbi:hypothetical protein C6P42_003135 [Pichia californica]|nr:hypothetical protein C6P42_003135 [[Candida] californica]
MLLNHLEARDDFYSDLTPVTDKLVATTSQTSSASYTTLSEITNSATSIQSSSYADILTDCDTSSDTIIILSTTASPTTTNSVITTSTSKSGSNKNYALSSSANAAPNYSCPNTKYRTLLFGLLGSSFLLSLL